MKARHVALAVLVAAIWGLNFTVIHVGLGSCPPLLLAALRFVVAALPAALLPRPPVPWPRFLLIGATLFLGQFAFLFVGMALGMPPGLASVALQAQAFLTILIAAIALGERPAPRQIAGTLVALAGLAIIAGTAGAAGVTVVGLVLCLASALCWAIGNVLLRGIGRVDTLPLMVWLSVVPPVPLFLLSLALDGPAAVSDALTAIGWNGAGAIAYIAVLATIVGFGIWGELLKRYPAGTVAPFSLLVPVFGAGSAAVFLGERFGPARLSGMALILVGLVIVTTPLGRVLKAAVLRLRAV